MKKLHVANYPPSLVLFHRKNQDAFKGAVLVAVQLPAWHLRYHSSQPLSKCVRGQGSEAQ